MVRTDPTARGPASAVPPAGAPGPTATPAGRRSLEAGTGQVAAAGVTGSGAAHSSLTVGGNDPANRGSGSMRGDLQASLAGSPRATDAGGSAGRARGATAAGAGGARTADGYTVDQCIADMQRLQRHDRREGGPQRSPAQLRPIAEGIVAGVNKYFSAPGYGSGTQMAHTLISSAWKESKFDLRRSNGSVFQCAGNRVAEYNAAHGTRISQASLSHMDPQRSIDIQLYAMAHPSHTIVGRSTGRTAIPRAAGQAALYYWNYNSREIGQYMSRTRYFQSILGQGQTPRS